MIKIMFLCHGNICRSPMAEYLLKDREFETEEAYDAEFEKIKEEKCEAFL